MDKRGKQCGILRSYKNKRVIGSVLPEVMPPINPRPVKNVLDVGRFHNMDAEMSDASSINGGGSPLPRGESFDPY